MVKNKRPYSPRWASIPPLSTAPTRGQIRPQNGLSWIPSIPIQHGHLHRLSRWERHPKNMKNPKRVRSEQYRHMSVFLRLRTEDWGQLPRLFWDSEPNRWAALIWLSNVSQWENDDDRKTMKRERLTDIIIRLAVAATFVFLFSLLFWSPGELGK